MVNPQTGSLLAFAGAIVLIFSHFGFIVNQTDVVQVIAGALSFYGIIHQFFITKKVVTMAKEAGVKGIK